MFGLGKTPPKVATQDSVDPGFSASSSYNPFDSDAESVNKATQKPARRTASESFLKVHNSKGNPFDDDDEWGRRASSNSSSSSHSSSAAKARNKNRIRDSRGLENQSVEELENYAVYKAEETTKRVNNCLKIAGDIREVGTKTLETLQQQGKQITRTHNMIVDTEKDLTKGEKLLNSLGGLFSKSWKPKKTRNIQGPVIITTPDNLSKKSEENKEKRERLGIAALPKGKSASKTLPAEPSNAYQKVEVEKGKQDDALSDLSNILVDLKGMAVDMGTELDRQNKAMDHLSLDVDEMNSRVKGANQRAHKLIG